MKPSLVNIIAFCVLMEHGEGIIDKSPDYITEKFERYIQSTKPDEFKWGLDLENTKKLENYLKKWFIQ